jgi:putative spermidine/putrescine transport system permease protein
MTTPWWFRALHRLALLTLMVWLILPLIPLAIWSFAKGWRFPDLLPQVWSTQAWHTALSARTGVLESLWVTGAIAALTTILAVVIGVPAGRALGQHQFRGKGAVQALILAPLIVPGIAVALGLHAVFLRLGLTNSFAGVVLVHLIPTLPYMIIIMTGIFTIHDPAFEAQARSLGASPWQSFRHIILPAILPGMIVGGLFCFLVSWSQYILTLLIGGGRVQTLPLVLFSFATSGRNDLTGAISMIYILPGLLILILTARHLTGTHPALAGLGRR